MTRSDAPLTPATQRPNTVPDDLTPTSGGAHTVGMATTSPMTPPSEPTTGATRAEYLAGMMRHAVILNDSERHMMNMTPEQMREHRHMQMAADAFAIWKRAQSIRNEDDEPATVGDIAGVCMTPAHPDRLALLELSGRLSWSFMMYEAAHVDVRRPFPPNVQAVPDAASYLASVGEMLLALVNATYADDTYAAGFTAWALSGLYVEVAQ